MSVATLSMKFFLLALLFQIFKAQTCTDGSYFDTTLNSCQTCDQGCQTCKGPTASDCTACYFGILYNNQCYPECDTSMYFNTDSLSCDICHPSCSECTGGTAQDCTVCYPPNTLENGKCKCQTGQYLDDFGICQTCNTFCSDCTGPLATQCLTCYNNMVESNGECVCPTGSAMDINGKQCVACSDSCAQCSTTTPATCQACKNNLVLQNGDCTCTGSTYLDTATYTCKTCPAGTYFSNGQCAACYGTCQACTGPLETDCSTCKTGLTKGTDNKCACTGSTFLDTTTFTCKACDATCTTCSAASATSCLTCPSGMTLSASKTCECNQGTYWDSASTSCKACHGSCQACTGPLETACSTCKTGLTKGTDNKCGCTGKNFLDTTTYTCKTCDATCATCSAASTTSCLTCPSGMTLSASKACECNQGTYWDATSSSCKTCYGGCQSCSGGLETDCSTCKSGLTKGTDGKCGCTGKTYLNTATFTCDTCNSACDQCSGPSASQCVSCPTGMTLSASKTCECNQGTYWDSATSSCKTCAGGCQACTGALETDCSTCKAGLTKGTDGKCGCTGNTYLNTATYTCSSCASTCDGCSGPSTTQCNSCKSGLIMIDDTGKCGCPVKMYLNEDEGICYNCDSSCSYCSGPNPSDCAACPEGQVLIGGVCSACPSGTYFDTEASQCLVCHKSCDKCTGSGQNNCATCKNNLILGSEGQCTCPISQFLSADGTKCESCASTCSECSGASYDQCTVCKSGWTFSNGKCIQSCSQGQYNAQDGSCSVCDSSCLSCNGSGSNSCLTCPSGQTLTNGKCTAPISSSLCPEGLIFVEDQDTCLSQCPPSYYIGARGSDQVCTPKTVIENRLSSTRKIDEYRIIFNADITQLYSELASKITVSIEFRAAQQQPLQYNSTLSLNDDAQSILVTFGIDGHLLPSNLMVVTFNLPDDDNSTRYTLLNKELYVQMFEYYAYSPSTNNAVQTTQKMTEVGQKTNEVITWGTSFILQSIHSIRSELMESMIAYFLYMNISFPPNFISYAMGNLEASDMFLPNSWTPILDALEKSNNVDDIETGRRLEEADVGVEGQGLGIKDSDLRFLSDVGTSVTFLLVVLILIGIFDFLFYIVKRKKMHGKPIYKVTEFLNYHLKWSYFINEFISEYQGLTFASLVALIYTKRFQPDVVFDYVFSVIFFIITVVSMVLVLYLIRYIHRNNKRNNPAAIAAAVVTAPERVVTDGILVTAGAPVDTHNSEDPAHQSDENMKPIMIRLNVLHIEYNNKTFAQLLYPLFLMIRCFGFTLVLALCQSSPVFQCVYLMLVTIAIMVYIIVVKPFRKRAQMILSLIYEGIFLITAIIALSLHLYNRSHLDDIETRSMLGFGIVACALLLMIINFVALFFEILELRKYIKHLKVLMFWKKSMPVGPMQQLTRADTKQPLEETQHSHLNTQLTSSNSNLLKMGIRKSISIDEKTFAKGIGSSKEISFTDEVNRTDEGTMTLNNLPTEPQVKANNNTNDSSASIFKFYKYSMKEVDDEIKEDPEEVVNESFNPEKVESKSPISSLNKLAGAEDYDAFNCSSIDRLDSILKKERESDKSLKGHDLESKISLPESGNDTLKEGLQQEDLETQQQQGGRSKSKTKRSRTKSKEKSKGHKRSLNSIAAIFGFTYTDVSGKTVISKITPNKSKKVAPLPKRIDWSADMSSQGDRQIEERNFSNKDDEKENEHTRTIVSARDEKTNPWNNTLDMKIMLNSARTNELNFLNHQISSQKDSEECTLDKFIRVQPFESLESLPIDKDESSLEYQLSKEDIQDTNQTPSKEKSRNKAFEIHTKRLRSMKSMKSMKSIDENDEEPKADTEQSEIRIQDEGNRSRQKLARPLGRKRGDVSVDKSEQKKEGRPQRVFSLNPKKE